MVTPRKTALNVLTRCERDGGYSNLVLDRELEKTELSAPDRALVSHLVFGVISRKITLDHYISALSAVAGSKLEPQVKNILRMGLYQLIYMDRIPPHAAVNESVALSPQRAKGFVNALLRGYMRRSGEIKLPDDPIERMSVERAIPIELCEALIAEYGFERSDSIFAALNQTPPLTLRVNTLKTDREELLARFAASGICASPSALSENGVEVDGAVVGLPGFADGDFFVQDAASQLCCAALGVRSGQLFIDCCSAPGSKSFGAAMHMAGQGRIVSCDLHENKLSLIRDSARRLGIDIIEARAADARLPISELVGQADAVLCDVPCSGYGVIAKKPEIRFKPLEDAGRLPNIQYAILENAAGYVKPGGALVYSTCTLLSAENADIAARFAVEHPEFEPEGFSHAGRDFSPMTQLLPDTDGCDGFFIAKFRKRS